MSSSPKPLPKRCTTCGGKGWYMVPDFPDTPPEKQNCIDCVGGIADWIYPEEGNDG